jgi:drug/metabolite transporter (DMT)-like permease
MRSRLVLVLAVLAISTGAPFAHWAWPAPALMIATLRVSLASLLLATAGHRGLSRLSALGGRDRGLVLLAGAFLAIHFASWIASLELTSTAASVALVCTNPMFAAMFGRLLGDRVAPRELAGIAIAVGGCAVLAGFDWRAGGKAVLGDGLALVGAASGAAYLVVGRRLRDSVPLLPYLSAVNAVAALGLVAAAAIAGDLVALPAHSYAACAGAALVASLVGHSLLNAAVRTTPAHLVALAVLGEPIGSSLITWAAFGEEPPIHAVAGGAIVLAGIAVGFVRRSPTRINTKPPSNQA